MTKPEKTEAASMRVRLPSGSGQRVYVITETNLIEKHFKEAKDYKHELRFLRLLSDCKHFPTVVQADDESLVITMQHAGRHLTEENCPPDYKSQLQEIGSALWQADIFHNDVWKLNMVIDASSGVITLLDFGWASFDAPSHPYMNLTRSVIEKAASLSDLLKSIWASRISPHPPCGFLEKGL